MQVPNHPLSPSSTWLAHAHAALDRAVWAAYGWPPDEDPTTVPDETIRSHRIAQPTPHIDV